jgi:hypothetical protein
MFNLVKPGVLINVEDTLQLLSKQTDLYAAKKIVEDMINQFGKECFDGRIKGDG